MMLMMVKIMSQDHESRSSLMMLMMVNIMIDDGQDVYLYACRLRSEHIYRGIDVCKNG